LPKIFLLRVKITLFLIALGLSLKAQEISGHVKDAEGKPLMGVNLILNPQGKGTSSDKQGHFSISYQAQEEAQVLEVSYLGFRSQKIEIEKVNQHLDITLKEDRLGLEEVVVSGSRQAISRYNSPVIVETLDPELFDQVSALSLAEGLSFSPGLRLENNCQNCGFTQLRINGLDGAYSQILMNSRPIFSSLMAVYGLEMIPANMIERVEVVRGGGSALYGGNAIGGTVNIITKEPHENQFFAQSQIQSIGGEAWENSNSFGASFSGPNLKSGINLFSYTRDRSAWDANQDGFTEITELENRTLGLNAFWKPSSRSKLSLDLFSINEYRRGGSDLNLKPHESRIAEQLEHRIFGGGLAWESLSADGKHQYSIYLSGQQTHRDSYYGAGGRPLAPGDSLNESDLLALNAYGNTDDLSLVGGAQYAWRIINQLHLSIGSEYQYNSVEEEIPGYQRQIEQSVHNWGSYLQAAWNINDQWKLELGNRLDIISIEAYYQLGSSHFYQDKPFVNLSPRLNMQYIANDDWQFRASYSRGFRNPQAFNEDLHIETVGGAALFIRLDENLISEISHSINVSTEHLIIKSSSEHQLLFSGFYTQLQNPFVLIDRQGQIDGTAVQLKANGDNAIVRGINLEYQGAWRSGLQIQGSITLQEAFYQSPQLLWQNPSDEQDRISSVRFLRTPNLYGYLNASFPFADKWMANAAISYTGSMQLVRLADPETEELELLDSPDFVDVQASIQRQLFQNDNWELGLKLGVKNIFNAFQSDLPTGPDRDASYIYGPILPRTYYLSIKLDFLP